MTRGELERVAFALYKIAKVEEKINDVFVWKAIGTNGMDNVQYLREAISALSRLILDDADRSIKLQKESES